MPRHWISILFGLRNLPRLFAAIGLVGIPIYYWHTETQRQDRKREDSFYASLTFMDMRELSRTEQETLMVCMYNVKIKSRSMFTMSGATPKLVDLKSSLAMIMADQKISKAEYIGWLTQYENYGFRYQLVQRNYVPRQVTDAPKAIRQEVTESFGIVRQ